MCGIVGYLGPKNAEEVLISGLSKLEYRGYDSAGISVMGKDGIVTVKSAGRLKNLEERLNESHLYGNEGIGHTRWATHGAPSDTNSHPHNSADNKFSVVHNGIIENYMELKEELKGKGFTFRSETDTEVIPNLIEMYYEGDLLSAVMKATERVRGSYALGVISSLEPGKLIAVRKDSPLIVGLGENGEGFIASDVPAVLNYTRNVVYLNDMEFTEISEEGIKFFDKDRNEIKKTPAEITWSTESAEKGGFDHFTMKEIHEQPKAVKDTLMARVIPGEDIKLDDIKITEEELRKCRRIFIVACGTAYHSGLAGKTAIERLAGIPAEAEVASEFRYSDPLVDENSIVIVISQSGETADTLAVLRDSKKKGARVIAITNVVGSSVSREADDVLYTWAGPEIGVASTKAYLTQLTANYMIAIKFAEILGTKSNEELDEIKKEMLALPEKIEKILEKKEEIKNLAGEISKAHDVYFLGRGLDYVTAVEGALKLKELTYIHAEAYKGGELKHGPIALIEEGTQVIVPVTQIDLLEKMQSNIKEVVTRGAEVTAVAEESMKELEKFVKRIIYIPETISLLTPVLAIVPLQLLSYYVCSEKGFDIDKPRNLAKSVTVE